MDFRHKVMGGRESALKTLVGVIPGYGEYQQKEKRRDADKLLRTHIAEKLTEQRGRITNLQAKLVRTGQLSAIGTIDRLNSKLVLLIDSIRNASYGYAGWFDSITINDGDLDALYDFDAGLSEGVDEITSAVTGLEEAISSRSDIDAAVDTVAQAIDHQNEGFQQRQEYVIEGKRVQAQFPTDVLKPEMEMSPEAVLLWNLKLKDAVTVSGTDYLVEGRIATTQSNNSWRRYFLKDSENEQWLWIGDGGSTIALLHDTPVQQEAIKENGLTLENGEFKLEAESADQVEVEGASGRSRDNYVRVRRFHGNNGNFLWIENWGTETRALIGTPISAEEIKVWKK